MEKRFEALFPDSLAPKAEFTFQERRCGRVRQPLRADYLKRFSVLFRGSNRLPHSRVVPMFVYVTTTVGECDGMDDLSTVVVRWTTVVRYEHVRSTLQ